MRRKLQDESVRGKEQEGQVHSLSSECEVGHTLVLSSKVGGGIWKEDERMGKQMEDRVNQRHAADTGRVAGDLLASCRQETSTAWMRTLVWK